MLGRISLEYSGGGKGGHDDDGSCGNANGDDGSCGNR